MQNFTKKCSTFYCTIHMAGPIEIAKQIIAKFVMRGACVQVTPCTYIYTGGREEGFQARIINYPRFEKSVDEIMRDAVDLAEELVTELCQASYTIENPFDTYYYQREGMKK